jgi:subtilase family serine protease
VLAALLPWLRASAQQTPAAQVLAGHVPKAVSELHLPPVGRLPGAQRLQLAIGLPLRNQAALGALLQQLYDPASPQYHQYLTTEQFTEKFGPTTEEYQAVVDFAKANGLTVTATFGNRVLLDVEGTVADVERTLHLTMRVYNHPQEARTFFAPDTEPSPDLAVPILHINGLDNYTLPFPKLVPKPASKMATKIPNAGSGPGGTYLGGDFRNAYVPGTSLTGAGQNVALFELDGYYAVDISNYVALAGLAYVPLVNEGSVTPGVNGGVDEVSLDIEMAISMAPGLSHVYVYEGTDPDTVLNSIASGNLAHQISCSWGWTPGPDLNADNIFQEMAVQGQTFFDAVGDSDAFLPGTADTYAPATSSNITEVGGTTLSTTGPLGSYVSETVWNWCVEYGEDYCSSRSHHCRGCVGPTGSSGGISTYYPIPVYQQGINMTANGGSTTDRNVPDVALTADNVYVIANNGADNGSFGGTSCAAPLWAAFIALVNQQAAANGMGPVGFLNPALYAIGKGTNYTNCFHDITTGNNEWASTPTNYTAVTGYDLCTGWGTPNGTNLINALVSPPQSPMVVNFTATPTNGAAPLMVNFTDTSTGSITNRLWNFGDGGTTNVTTNGVVYTYITSGVYTVTEIVTGLGGSSTNTQPNSITVLTPFQAWQIQYFGSTNNPNAAPGVDYTGNGMSNTNQFLAGFNPTDSSAYPHIISITKTNATDIKVIYLGANGDSSWTPGIASRTNVLEFTTGTTRGGYSNDFASTGQTNILSGGTGFGIVTNMVDRGGATNGPARYYRIKVITP